MFFRSALASLFHLFAIFVFFVAAAFALCLFCFESVRFRLIELLFAQPQLCLLGSAFLAALGCLMTVGFFALHRGKYLRIRLEPARVDIDMQLLRQAIDHFFAEHFPHQISLLDVAAPSKNRLEIEVETERIELIQELEERLVPHLQEQFGILSPLYLTIRF